MEIASKIQKLQEERHTAVKRMREILDAAEADSNRALTAEERSEYDSLETDVEEKGQRISDEKKLRARELELEERDAVIDPRQAQGGEREDGKGVDSPEYARAFIKYLRDGDVGIDRETRDFLRDNGSVRDQAKGTSNLGGYLVPTDFQKKLELHAVEAGAVRNTRVNVIVTGTGEALQIPKTTVHGAATWVAEGQASSAVDETFGQVTLNAYTVRRLIKVSVELVEDEAVNLISYLGKAIGQSIGFAENDAYLNGDGSTQPNGLIALLSAGKVGAPGQATSVTSDDLFDLYYSVIPAYRRNGEWLMNDSTIKAVRKLKDSNGQYVWSPTGGYNSVLQNNAPDSLLGKPLHADPSMAAMAANAKSIVFGDFSAYTIRDVGQAGPEPSERPMGAFGVIRMNERFMDSLTIGFLGYHRTDGDLVDTTGALKLYVNSAT